MRCSAQSWLTESKVVLNEGTTLTLVNEKAMRWPSVEIADTGMSPMPVQRTMRPLASPKTSSHGRMLVMRQLSLVAEAVQPESSVAEKLAVSPPAGASGRDDALSSARFSTVDAPERRSPSGGV
jgi:hypothetical protein